MASRANVEVVLVKRVGPLMSKAGLAVTFAGSNADLADPIAWALRQAGYSVADITDPTTAEVATVGSADLDEALDYAEYRLLETILGNLDDVDTTVGPRTEKLNQLSEKVEKRLKRLGEKLEDEYGFGATTPQIGVVTYEVAEHET